MTEKPLRETKTKSVATLPRVLFWLLLVVFVFLQLRLWTGDGSLAEVWQLRGEIDKQQQENYVLSERNRRLTAEVKDLKEGMAAVEERARSQLGMIKKGETFYLIIDEKADNKASNQ
ncbi:cell division protein FtsB [Gammaproteobacteria bacterium 42_54_T18]|nr:cell division protein FtsB [Gammaproteobacteria bacterium 42_54_T18]